MAERFLNSKKYISKFRKLVSEVLTAHYKEQLPTLYFYMLNNIVKYMWLFGGVKP